MDNIDHPAHYEQARIAIQPIDVLRYAPFCLGNALKYIIRAGCKGDPIEDLAKARKYIDWELENSLSSNAAYDFFNRYGVLLRKFKRLKSVNSLSGVSAAIKKLEKEYGNKR